MSEKTHDATDKHLGEMRKEGQVARSQDVGRMVVLAGVVEIVLMMRTDIFLLLQEMQVLVFNHIGADFALVGIDTAWIILRKAFLYSIGVVMLAGAIHILASCLQLGWVFSPKAIKIHFEKLDPVKKIQEIFGKTQLWEFITTIIKLIILAGVGLMALQAMFMPIINLVYGASLDMIWEVTAHVLAWQVRMSTLILVAIAGLDFLMQRKFHKENARMDLQEIKQESRESEGDPEAKGARREMGHAWLNEETTAAPSPVSQQDRQAILDKTDLLLTNPTHFAVALSYQGGLHPLPIVLYKQRGEEALEFIYQAQARKIYIKRDPWLARHLFAHCYIGQPITHKAVLPVAGYYRDVFRAKPVVKNVLKKPRS